ncbi:peptidoglycan recognition protein family protein [Hespellia stercorisuis]|uniref:N-acetylmuramoyl-L-alanine amidase n=1 Tax=Hespellia stercorisuis DSM 15480 TaxID=1121950 RepID=A0A1M6TPH3_9FIRM|nr:peptidoglycan recognition family protein [Hespellia stercorisuis]SHK58837.1 N-acetylmuramoyl-L-alanine amidase [Hespellia stercorisuis DSM 15480]
MKKRSTTKKKKNYLKELTKDKKKLMILVGTAVLVVILVGLLLRSYIVRSNKYTEKESAVIDASKPDIDVQLLTVNDYSRPGIETDRIRGIVVHYTANPGATAQNNRDYFEGLKDTHETSVSSNFVVGLDGEIIQCVPTWEVAYASNDRNHDTVSIECCHPDETGEFSTATYNSLVQLTAWLCMKFGLDQNDVIRHYDVTGKNCPKYYVENEKEWIQFKEYVKAAMERSEANQ